MHLFCRMHMLQSRARRCSGINASSFDHVYIVVENLEDKDTGEVYPIGLLGIGGSNIGLQTYNAYEWYQNNSGNRIAYGTQPQKAI